MSAGPCTRAEIVEGGVLVPTTGVVQSAAVRALVRAAPDLLAALKDVERHCPCGARPETPRTHPHVVGCLVGNAIAKAEGQS